MKTFSITWKFPTDELAAQAVAIFAAHFGYSATVNKEEPGTAQRVESQAVKDEKGDFVYNVLGHQVFADAPVFDLEGNPVMQDVINVVQVPNPVTPEQHVTLAITRQLGDILRDKMRATALSDVDKSIDALLGAVEAEVS